MAASRGSATTPSSSRSIAITRLPSIVRNRQPAGHGRRSEPDRRRDVSPGGCLTGTSSLILSPTCHNTPAIRLAPERRRATASLMATSRSPSSAPMKRLVFVVTEDWFFASHFLPMARAAVAMGLSVAVVTRVRAHRAVIEATGGARGRVGGRALQPQPHGGGLCGGPARGDPEGAEGGYRPLHRAALDPRRRDGGGDGGYLRPGLCPDRTRPDGRARRRRGTHGPASPCAS